MVKVPVPALRFALMVMVELPVPPTGEIDVGLKLMETPFPCPDADNEIEETVPLVTAALIVTGPELPLGTVIEVGDALNVKLPDDPLTVSAIVVVATMLPEVPVTVMV